MLLLAFFVLLTIIGVAWRFWLIRAEAAKQRVLFSVREVWCDSVACVGITAVGRGDLSRLDNLLTVSYPR